MKKFLKTLTATVTAFGLLLSQTAIMTSAAVTEYIYDVNGVHDTANGGAYTAGQLEVFDFEKVAGDGIEKAADDYYYRYTAKQGGEKTWVVSRETGNVMGDSYIKFDYKQEGASQYFTLTLTPYNADGTTGSATHVAYISNKGEFKEYNVTFLGSSTTEKEFLAPKEYFNVGKWNTFEMEVCGASSVLKCAINGRDVEIPLNGNSFFRYGISKVELKTCFTVGDILSLDNIYMRTGVTGAPASNEAAYTEINAETGYHNGHIHEIEEYVETVTESIYTADGSADPVGLSKSGIDYSIVTAVADDNSGKTPGDSYYVISVPEGGTATEKRGGIAKIPGVMGDMYIGFDYKSQNGWSYMAMQITPWNADGTKGTAKDLVYIRPNVGVGEYSVTFLGQDANTKETLIPNTAFSEAGWNSIRMEICCLSNTLKMMVNKNYYEIALNNSEFFRYGIAEVVLFPCFGATAVNVMLDNIYAKSGVTGAPASFEGKFEEINTETNCHNGHINEIESYLNVTQKVVSADGTQDKPYNANYTNNVFSKITPAAGDGDEKSIGDSYYKFTPKSKGQNAEKLFTASGVMGDMTTGFDFKFTGSWSYMVVRVKPFNADCTVGAEKSLFYIRANDNKDGGIFEYQNSGVIGTDEAGEKLLDREYIRYNTWNNITMDFCCLGDSIDCNLNGYDFEIPLMENSEYFRYGIAEIYVVPCYAGDDSAIMLDNIFVKSGVTGTKAACYNGFTDVGEDGLHKGHLVTEASVKPQTPIEIAKSFDLDVVATDSDKAVYPNAYLSAVYAKPGATVSDVKENLELTKEGIVKVYTDDTMTVELSDEDAVNDSSMIKLILSDANGTERCYSKYYVLADALDYGVFHFNGNNYRYSALGFNPTLTESEIKELYNGTKIEIPAVKYGREVMGVSHNAFWSETVSYPEIDFELSDENTWIGDNSFRETGITNVSSGTKTQGYMFKNSFRDCKKLTTLILGEQMLGIGAEGFMGCDNLESITLQNGMLNMRWALGRNIFAGCPKLKSIEIKNANSGYINPMFLNGWSSLETIKITDGGNLSAFDFVAASYNSDGSTKAVAVSKQAEGEKILNIPSGDKIELMQFNGLSTLKPVAAKATLK